MERRDGDKNKKKSTSIWGTLLLAGAVGLGAYFIGKKLGEKKVKETSENENEKEEKELTPEQIQNDKEDELMYQNDEVLCPISMCSHLF